MPLWACTACLCFATAPASAQTVTAVSGTVSNGQTVTIAGSSFGSSGPKTVIFDDFEGGTPGQSIANHAATVGAWDNMVDSSPPRYDSSFRVSGSKSMKSDFRIASGSSVQASISPAESDIFLSYWVYLPTTSEFPGADQVNGPPNWKISWAMHTPCCSMTDVTLPTGLTPGPPAQDFFESCNNCLGDVWLGGDPGTSPMVLNKGKWYRMAAWVHGASDASGHRDMWFLSTDDNVPLTRGINRSGAIFSSAGPYFDVVLVGAYGRLSTQESSPRYDDVYLAVGPNARARVEIGDASTYAACKNLAIATVNSWSATSISAVVRQGSFASLDKRYLYVTNAAGVVSNGYLLSSTSVAKPSPPTNVRIIKMALLSLFAPLGGVGMVLASRRARRDRP